MYGCSPDAGQHRGRRRSSRIGATPLLAAIAVTVVAVAVAPWTILPEPLEAQDAGRATAARLLTELPLRTEVRLRTRDGARLEGWLHEADTRAVVIVDRLDRRHTIPLEEVTDAWSRENRSRQLAEGGASVGAIGFGLFVGVAAWGLCDKAVCDGEFHDGLMLGAPIGAVGGAALGAAVGALLHRWVPLLEAEDHRQGRLHMSLAVGRSRPASSEEPERQCDRPPAVSSVRGSVGWTLRSRLDLVAELGDIGFAEEQCRVDSSSPLVEDDARTTSYLVGINNRLDPDGHVVVGAFAGLADTRLNRRVFDRRTSTDTATTSRSTGLQLGASLRAGWTLRPARHARVGFEARGDWISRSPIGSVSLFTFALSVWG